MNNTSSNSTVFINDTTHLSGMQEKSSGEINNEKNELINENDTEHERINDLEIFEYKYIGSNITHNIFNDDIFITCLQSSPTINQVSLVLAQEITDKSIEYLAKMIPYLISLEIISCKTLTENSYITIMDNRVWYTSMKSLSLRNNDQVNFYYLLNLFERYTNCLEFDVRCNTNLDIKECILYLMNPLNFTENESCYTIQTTNKYDDKSNKENTHQNYKEILVMCSCSPDEKYENNLIVIENHFERIIFHISE